MYQVDEVVDVWPQRQDNRVVFAGAADEEVELAEQVVQLRRGQGQQRVTFVHLWW